MWRIFLDKSAFCCCACLPCRFLFQSAQQPAPILVPSVYFGLPKRADLPAQCCGRQNPFFWLGCCYGTSSCLLIAVVLAARVRSMPSNPSGRRLPKTDIERRKMNLISRYIINQMAVMAVYALLAFLALYSFLEIINEVGDLRPAITAQSGAVCLMPDACAHMN